MIGPAGAESVLERFYPSAKLAELWAGTLGSADPEPDRFALLAPGSVTPEPVTMVTGTDFGLPFEGVVIGESATPAGGTEARAFPVIPMGADDASVLNRRLAWAEIYLARYRFFEAVSTDDAAVMAALAERQYGAALEAYLVTARLYFATPDLPEKCRRLTRLQELAAGPLTGLAEERLPAAWRPLLPIQAATATRLGGDALAALVCSVQAVRGRAETIRIVETRVRERIMTEVRAKVTDTLQLLEASSTEFQSLVNQMDVPILSAEILELERVLGNAAANMILIKEDQLKAATTIATLQAVDLSALNQPEALQELTDGKARMTAMSGLIDAVMAALADLANLEGDPTATADLGPCANLRGVYPALDLGLDTGTLTQTMNGPYEDCLARARGVVSRFQEPSLDKALMAELARHVRQISEAFLSTVSP
jgi:hypothetical protein